MSHAHTGPDDGRLGLPANRGFGRADDAAFSDADPGGSAVMLSLDFDRDMICRLRLMRWYRHGIAGHRQLI
ncbi:hypothetical protein VTN96DRAFT_9377 [Rasamsonia emersonii]